MVRGVVWHRYDLRLRDNVALSEAGNQAMPVYIFDPKWLENSLVSDTRIEFVMECLKDINRQYIIKGSRISLLYGDPIEELENLKQKGYDIYFNKDANHFRQEMEQQARKNFKDFLATELSGIKKEQGKNGGIVRENIFKANHLKFQKVLKTTL